MGIEIAATADASGGDEDDEIAHRYGERLSNNAIFDVVFFVGDAALNGVIRCKRPYGMRCAANVMDHLEVTTIWRAAFLCRHSRPG